MKLAAEETWDHAQAHKWNVHSIYEHVDRLASTLLSTKESLEDLLGDLGDRASRDSKVAFNVTPERLFMQSTLSSRLQQREPEYLKLLPGDYVNEAGRKHSRQRKLIFGEQAPMRSKVTQDMKALVSRGGHSRMPSCVHCAP